MALANVAWILAANSKRVLVIDWDLEAPGLHKYFGPFLSDPELLESNGLIDFVIDYAGAAAGRTDAQIDPPYANMQRFAVPIAWDFPVGGRIDFVPSGRQGVSYASRVNLFDWQTFYQKLNGGQFLDLAIQRMRSKYDYILIDSRTGVSDTAGICTVQLPDDLVVFFTLNHQSIGGASEIAKSAVSQRPADRPLRVFPVPTRVDRSEKAKLEAAQVRAQAIFYPFVTHIDLQQRDAYWGAVQIDYEAFYSYEEVLAPFAEQRLNSSGSMLSSIQRLAEFLTGVDLIPPSIAEHDRRDVLARFALTSNSDVGSALENLAAQYEEIRAEMKAGPTRTRTMNNLVSRAFLFADGIDIVALPQQMFSRNRPGTRVVALALAEARTRDEHLPLVVEAISSPVSQFEQFHALMVARQLMRSVQPSAKALITDAIRGQIGKYITESDPSRWVLANDILESSKLS